MVTESAEQQARDLLDAMEIDGAQNFSSGELVELANLIAERNRLAREVDRLHTWDGLMELLNEHWPEDIFPTMPDIENRDPGPRIVSLLRWVEQLRARESAVRDLCTESVLDKQMRELSRGFDGRPNCAHTVHAADILAALDTQEPQ